MNAGDLTKAEQLLLKAIGEGNNVAEAWNNLGVIYQRQNNPSLAIQAYNMSARYGSRTAQQNLVALGQTVPTPDLARVSTEGMSNAEALLLLTTSAVQGYNQGKQMPQQPNTNQSNKINCTSTTYGKTVETNCR